MSDPVQRYYGKYRGTVVNNIDPLMQGRIQAMVPDVLGEMPSSWAMACVPIAGAGSGVFVLPAVNSGVWIEFEYGDPDRPIWSGGWWGSTSDLPPDAVLGIPGSPSIVMQTFLGNKIVVSDIPAVGGIKLATATGLASIEITDVGITIKCGAAQIKLDPVTVDVNNGALKVI